MPGGAAAIARAIARAAARRAASRAASSRGSSSSRGRGAQGSSRSGRRAGRGYGSRVFSEAEDGGADFVAFESSAIEAAQRGMTAMVEMAGSRGQLALLEDVAPKYGDYATRLADTGGKPAWSAVRGMSDHPEVIEDILQEGFEHLVKAYSQDVYQEQLALILEDEDESDGLGGEEED